MRTVYNPQTLLHPYGKEREMFHLVLKPLRAVIEAMHQVVLRSRAPQLTYTLALLPSASSWRKRSRTLEIRAVEVWALALVCRSEHITGIAVCRFMKEQVKNGGGREKVCVVQDEPFGRIALE